MTNQTPTKSTVNDPLRPTKKDWIVSRESIHAGGLIIEHQIQPPNELEVGSISHHVLGYTLNTVGSRQVTHIDGKEYDGEIERGYAWLKPDSSEGFWHWESIEEGILFAIEPAFLSRIATENDCLNSNKIEILPIIKTRDPVLDALAMQFQREMNHAELGNLMYIETLAQQFAIHLLREYCAFPATFQEYTGGLPRYKLKQAIDYINDNLDEKINIYDIAKLVDISNYYFCRMFHASMGISPYQYVLKQRVAKTKELLENSKLPLADIAFECGFSSQSQMTQHFRKQVGVTPKVYRNRL